MKHKNNYCSNNNVLDTHNYKLTSGGLKLDRDDSRGFSRELS